MSNYMNDLQAMEELHEEKEEILRKAGDKLASILIKMNDQGITNRKAIMNDINTALKSWSDDEKVKIMNYAVSKVVINL